WWETRIDHPSLHVRLFKNRSLSASVGSIALLFFGMGGVYFFTSFYLQNVRGYSPLTTGLLAVPFAVGQFVASPRSASLVTRYGARPVLLAGMLMNAVAIGGWAFLSEGSPIWIVAVLFFVQGSGLGLAVPAATSTVMEALPRERAGAGSALTNTARQVAVALSVAVLGSILSSAYRNGQGHGALAGCVGERRAGASPLARQRLHHGRGRGRDGQAQAGTLDEEQHGDDPDRRALAEERPAADGDRVHQHACQQDRAGAVPGDQRRAAR